MKPYIEWVECKGDNTSLSGTFYNETWGNYHMDGSVKEVNQI